jgi:hypothetical protein
MMFTVHTHAKRVGKGIAFPLSVSLSHCNVERFIFFLNLLILSFSLSHKDMLRLL